MKEELKIWIKQKKRLEKICFNKYEIIKEDIFLKISSFVLHNICYKPLFCISKKSTLNIVSYNATFLCRQESGAKKLSELDFRSLFACNFSLAKISNSCYALKQRNFLTPISKTANTHSNRLGTIEAEHCLKHEVQVCEAKVCRLACNINSIKTPVGRRKPACFFFLCEDFFLFTSQIKRKKSSLQKSKHL